MEHYYENLTDEFLENVRTKNQPVIYWDSAIKLIGIRVMPDERKIWMMRNGHGGSLDIGEYPDLSDRDAAVGVAFKALVNQVKELVSAVRDNGLPRSIACDAIEAAERLVSTVKIS